MCMIFICNSKLPTEDQLDRAETLNRDGIGVGWFDATKGLNHFRKDLTLKELNKFVKDIPFPNVIHFRAASVGGEHKSLIHPFNVLKEQFDGLEWKGKSPLLFHNGTWMKWKDAIMDSVIGGARLPDRHQPWSDSKAIAWLAATHGIGLLDFLDYGPGRLVILTSKPQLLTWGTWEKNEGFLSSRPLVELDWNTSRGYVFPHGGSSFQHSYPSKSGTESCEAGEEGGAKTGERSCETGPVQRITFPCPKCETLCTRSGQGLITCGACKYEASVAEAKEALTASRLEKLTKDNYLPTVIFDGSIYTDQELRALFDDFSSRLSVMRSARRALRA
jgi:hypothetical protein